MKMEKNKPCIELGDDNFGAVLNCAVRNAMSKKIYMPWLVTSFIVPLLPYLSYRTILCFRMDVKKGFDNGMDCEREAWMMFLTAVKAEEERRRMDGRPIDADALRKTHAELCPGSCVDCEYGSAANGRWFCGLIDNSPTVDAVPVVRCKDCKRYVSWDGTSFCELIATFGGSRNPDDFCSRGEPRA